MGSRAGNGSQVCLRWAALGGTWLLTLGTGTLALLVLQDQAPKLQGEAGMSLAGACSLPWLQSG